MFGLWPAYGNRSGILLRHWLCELCAHSGLECIDIGGLVGIDRVWLGGQPLLVLVDQQCGAFIDATALADAGKQKYLDLLVCVVRPGLAGACCGGAGAGE